MPHAPVPREREQERERERQREGGRQTESERERHVVRCVRSHTHIAQGVVSSDFSFRGNGADIRRKP
jgi:hypothetical protein